MPPMWFIIIHILKHWRISVWYLGGFQVEVIFILTPDHCVIISSAPRPQSICSIGYIDWLTEFIVSRWITSHKRILVFSIIDYLHNKFMDLLCPWTPQRPWAPGHMFYRALYGWSTLKRWLAYNIVSPRGHSSYVAWHLTGFEIN